MERENLLREKSFHENPRIEISSLHQASPEKEPRTRKTSSQTESGHDLALDEELIANSLSTLGTSADGRSRVFQRVSLSGRHLCDISVLRQYIHLQNVDISNNSLTDLSALSALPALTHLDASRNRLTRLLDFRPPARHLKVADLSYNRIADVGDLSEYRNLEKLVLDYNRVRRVGTGLSACRSLRILSLAHNLLEGPDALTALSQAPSGHEAGLLVTQLDISNNRLRSAAGLERQTRLQSLDFSGNRLRSLNGFEHLDALNLLRLDQNDIIDIQELEWLAGLNLLHVLTLRGNPVNETPDYRLAVLNRLSQLDALDDEVVRVEEKVAATNLFVPPPEVRAAADHRIQRLYQLFQPQALHESTLHSIETPYPILALVGPLGSANKELAMKLAEDFHEFFAYAKLYTTRLPYANEEVGSAVGISSAGSNDDTGRIRAPPGPAPGGDYEFVTREELQTLSKAGRLVCTFTCFGGADVYALGVDTIDAIARQGRAAVFPLELEGALSLKKTHLEPRLVLTLALEPSVQEQRLRDMNLGFRDAALRWAVGRTRAHLDWHRAHPGFFDALFATDDIVGAFVRLQQLVSDYLGLGGLSESQTADRASRSRDDEPEPENETAKDGVLNTPSELSPQQIFEAVRARQADLFKKAATQ